MIKKILLSLFACSIFLAEDVNAEVKIGKGTLTFNVGISSQYIFRGIDQNKDNTSAFVGTDLSHPVGDFNLYLGAWTGAQDSVAGAGGKEIDYYAGITKSFGSATFDLGYGIFTYPGADTKATKATAEFYGKLTIAPDKQPYTFGLAYYVDDTDGQKNGTSKVDRNYYEFNAGYNFGPVQGFASYGVWDKETKTTTLSLSKELVGVGFTASYISADREGSLSGLDRNRDYAILTAKKVF
jgi:uncharacterized protein (TIGR02001 family)